MLRKTLYILFVALCAATAIESYARYRFADLVDRSRFEEMAFIRLLNSGVIYHPGTGNCDPRFGFLLTPNIRFHRNIEDCGLIIAPGRIWNRGGDTA